MIWSKHELGRKKIEWWKSMKTRRRERDGKTKGFERVVKLFGIVVLAVVAYLNYLWWKMQLIDSVPPRVDLVLWYVMSWGIVGGCMLLYRLRNRKKAYIVEEKAYFIIT